MKNIKKIVNLFVLLALIISTLPFSVKAEGEQVNLTIRSGSTIVFSGIIPLQPEGTVSLNDSGGTSHEINSRSVLALVSDADILSDSFNISNLTYFDSFGSLYLKCITHSSKEECDNWQYVVNGSYPFSGMDQNILAGGENIYLYFGPQNRVTLDKNTINILDSITVMAQKYDFENDSWVARTGVTIGITKPDPENPWSPIEILTSLTNENGQVTFSSIPVGEYGIGVKDDFYFPLENINVKNINNGMYSGENTNINESAQAEIKPKYIFNNQEAFEFLFSNQEEDGSLGENIYTDWAVIALATDEGNFSKKVKLVKYLSETSTSGQLLTDYQRRAMALMSFGLNPYNINGENYISKILSHFDGEQFGDKNLDNDDIFALIVLQNAGFQENDNEIQKTISFVLNKQKENGSWDESIDMTGAAMQALSPFQDNEDVFNSLQKAKKFLSENQRIDGGFGNISSTAWAIGGIVAIQEDPDNWRRNKTNPLEYIASNQESDGGIKGELENSRIWETSYAIVAISKKTWQEIMQKFEKQQIEVKGVSKTVTLAQKKTEIPKIKKVVIENSQEDIPKENTIYSNPTIQLSPEKERSWFGKVLNNLFGFLF